MSDHALHEAATAARPTVRDIAVADARACRDAFECRVNSGAYCRFGPADECDAIAADYLSMSALVEMYAAREAAYTALEAKHGALVEAAEVAERELRAGSFDIRMMVNPILASHGMHPFTQTPAAMDEAATALRAAIDRVKEGS